MNPILRKYLDRYQIQQHTPEWYEKRRKIISATKVPGYIESSKYNLTVDEDNDTNPDTPHQDTRALEFGIEHEDLARKGIENRMGVKIYELGLGIHEKYNWLGASPDGITVLPDGTVVLIEIKCPYWRQINYKIPFEYWIQMQMQMEVWDIDCVLYSENEFSKNEDEKGILLRYWDIQVYRDSEWFSKIFPILKRNKFFLTKEKRLFWKNSNDPYKIRNYIISDPIMDWLDRYYYLELDKYQRDPYKKYDLSKFAAKQTKFFHNEILKFFHNNDKPVLDISAEWIQQVQPSNSNWRDIISEPSVFKSYAKNKMTMDAMEKGLPVIADGILITTNSTNSTNSANSTDSTENRWGKVDLLVREDMMDKLWRTDTKWGNKPGMKYFVVLTRFSSLKITADGIHLLNEPKQKLYKAYISFLTDCLPNKFRHESNIGYIIGRKASWTCRKEKTTVEGFSNSIGVVDLKERDAHVPEIVSESLEWLDKLKTEGHTWRPIINADNDNANNADNADNADNDNADNADNDSDNSDDTIDNNGNRKGSKRKSTHRPMKKSAKKRKMEGTALVFTKPLQLYPNMKNKNDYPWHTAKKRIAKETNEITEIMNIGPDKRNQMVTDGITRWDQITADDLSTYKVSMPDAVNNILTANRDGVLLGIDEVKAGLRYHRYKKECYVDFETVTDLNEEIDEELFDSSPGIGGQSNIIYMIGCYVVDNESGQQEYFNYLIDKIDPENEKKIILDWMTDMNKHFSHGEKIPVYHWSPAETIQLKRVRAAYKSNKLKGFIDRLHCIDLYKIFKDSKVGIPGAFGYGLKTVAKALHNLGKIENTWEENLNGADAMVAAWYLNNRNDDLMIEGHKVATDKLQEAEKEIADKKEQPRATDELAKEIILYNYYDCKVMEEIVQFCRS